MDQPLQIVFADTFTQDTDQTENFDAIRFCDDRSIVVREVHICPNGRELPRPPGLGSVLADLHTSPSAFQLNVYARNLSRNDQAAYLKILSCQYVHGGENRFNVDMSVATDHLLVRGKYSVVSLVLVAHVVSPNTLSCVSAGNVRHNTNTTVNTAPNMGGSVMRYPANSNYVPVQQYVLTAPPTNPLTTHHVRLPVYNQPPPANMPSIGMQAASQMSAPLAFNPHVPPPSFSSSHGQLPPPPTPPNLVLGAPSAVYDPLRPPPVMHLHTPHMNTHSMPTHTAPAYSAHRALSAVPGNVVLHQDVSVSPNVLPVTHSTSNMSIQSTASTRLSASGNTPVSHSHSGTSKLHMPPSSSSSSSLNLDKLSRRSRHRKRVHEPERVSGTGSGDRGSRASSVQGAAHTTARARKRPYTPPMPPPKSPLPPQQPVNKSPPEQEPPAAVPVSVRTDSSPTRPKSSMSSNASCQDKPTVTNRSTPDEGIIRSDSEDNESIKTTQTSKTNNLENISDDEFEFTEASASLVLTAAEETLLEQSSATSLSLTDWQMKPCKGLRAPWLSECEQLQLADTPDTQLVPELYDAFIEHLLNIYHTEHSLQQNRADWLQVCEQRYLPELPALLARLLQAPTDVLKPACSSLLLWVQFGLNSAEAAQQVTANILVHLKTGIRLAALCSTAHIHIAQLLIMEGNVQHLLMDLYKLSFMSVPLKLLILEALERSMFYKSGYEALLTHKLDQHATVYQKLLDVCTGNQSARLSAACAVLLRKVALHRQLISLNTTTLSISRAIDDGDCEPENLSDHWMSVLDQLHYITLAIQNAPAQLVVSKHTLPVSVVYENKTELLDAMPALYRLLYDSALVDSVSSVLSACGRVRVQCALLYDVHCALQQLLVNLMQSQQGIHFLASQPQSINQLLKVLFANTNAAPQSAKSEGVASSRNGALPACGALLCSAMRVVENVHSLHALLQQDTPPAVSVCESVAVLDHLRQLFLLCNTPLGAQATAAQLAFTDNMPLLLTCLQLSGDQSRDSSRLRKSATASFAMELLLCTLRLHHNALPLIEHYEVLGSISAMQLLPKANELTQWMSCMKKCPGFVQSDEVLSYIVERLRLHNEQVDKTNTMSAALVPVLRLAVHLFVPEQPLLGAPKELYKQHWLCKLYAADVITLLCDIIQKCTEMYRINWQQGLSVQHSDGVLYMAIILPAVTLLCQLLHMLAHALPAKMVADPVCVPALCAVLAVCCTQQPVALTGTDHPPLLNATLLCPSTALKQMVVSALSSLCSVHVQLTQSEGDKHKDVLVNMRQSTCVRTLHQIIQFTQSAPYNMVAGLAALTHLLPLPLPVLTIKPLSDELCSEMRAARGLWTAHAMALEPDWHELLCILCVSTQPQLQSCVRRLCCQLAELGAPLAILVARCVCDCVLRLFECSAIPKRQSVEGKPIKEEAVDAPQLALPADVSLAACANLLDHLCAQVVCKMAVLHVLRDRAQLYMYMCTAINHVVSSTNAAAGTHSLMQHSCLGVLSSLCDINLALFPAYEDFLQTEVHDVAHCIPDSAQVQLIAVQLVQHLGHKGSQYSTIHGVLQLLILICNYDYGLFAVTKALRTQGECVQTLSERVLLEYKEQSTACERVLVLLCEWLRSLHIVPHKRPHTRTWLVRTQTVALAEWRGLLAWQMGAQANNQQHPLVKLNKMLMDDYPDSAQIQSLQSLIWMLSAEEQSTVKELSEPSLGVLIDVNIVFEERALFSVYSCAVSEQLSAHHCFPQSMLSQQQQCTPNTVDESLYRVSTDLEAIRQQFLPQFDPKDDLKRRLAVKQLEKPVVKRRLRPGIINTSKGDSERPIVAPIRGRGFVVPRAPGVSSTQGQSGQSAGNRHHHNQALRDSFRNRPQNTSRAPSMHVDDFLVMQLKAGVTTAPSQRALAPLPSSSASVKSNSPSRPAKRSAPEDRRSRHSAERSVTGRRSFEADKSSQPHSRNFSANNPARNRMGRSREHGQSASSSAINRPMMDNHRPTPAMDRRGHNQSQSLRHNTSNVRHSNQPINDRARMLHRPNMNMQHRHRPNQPSATRYTNRPQQHRMSAGASMNRNNNQQQPAALPRPVQLQQQRNANSNYSFASRLSRQYQHRAQQQQQVRGRPTVKSSGSGSGNASHSQSRTHTDRHRPQSRHK